MYALHEANTLATSRLRLSLAIHVMATFVMMLVQTVS
jgi:hypothetical protein